MSIIERAAKRIDEARGAAAPATGVTPESAVVRTPAPVAFAPVPPGPAAGRRDRAGPLHTDIEPVAAERRNRARTGSSSTWYACASSAW